MELREYLSIRRAYNLVRQAVDNPERLTFSEFAILCRLDIAGGSLKTSEIAEYQSSLRPTMTHRTKHLAKCGLIKRMRGDSDKRNVVCLLTDKGSDFERSLCAKTCSMIPVGQALHRVSPDRLRNYIDAMGSLSVMAGDLILVGIYASELESCSVTNLVDALGLLQPTVSMSVSALVDEGLLLREPAGSLSRSVNVSLTDKGTKEAAAIAEQIGELVVRRRARSQA